MEIKGRNIIGFESFSEGTVGIQAVNPATDEILGPLFYKATNDELNLAVEKANSAFGIYGKLNDTQRALFLDKIAEEIELLGDTLLERYVAESGLPMGRAQGERGRTCGQLRLFAQLIREGHWVNAKIDEAMPDRKPLPRQDLRSMEKPLGPVAVFGASNFPLAFSTAGGDTAAALAAGCPVVFKAHPSHLGTGELVAHAIVAAAKATNMPDGVFSLLFDDGIEVGQLLVKHPDIKAVAFTGSFKGGMAIYKTATMREQPIPVYAEMGSTNPVFILPKTLAENGPQIAAQYLSSVTLGVGQFCTNPGILMIQKNEQFINTLTEAAQEAQGGNMLNAGIKNAYVNGIEIAKKYSNVIAIGKKAEGQTGVEPVILHSDYSNFKDNPHLAEEIFGPTSVVVEANTKEEILDIASNLSGHLTATIHGSEEELVEYTDLINILEQKVGRLVINGFPTGVEVCHAMVHGGPFPATTDSRSTSVGTGAIYRFTRPVCYQDMPQALLPKALQDSNPLKVKRLINGVLS